VVRPDALLQLGAAATKAAEGQRDAADAVAPDAARVDPADREVQADRVDQVVRGSRERVMLALSARCQR
jgi:hypothetical protein